MTILYTAIFIFVIFKIKFFIIDGFSNKTISFVFFLKVLTGVALSLIYTYYYTDKTTADIFKYFNDSKVMYDALWTKPIDYFQMLIGIDNDNSYFGNVYYNQMPNWYRQYESNIYNDAHMIIRFNAFVRLFSFGYYNVHTVFMCFVSIIGLTALYKFFVRFLTDKKKELFFAVFLMPSVLFWGSGVLKEGILFCGLGLLIYYFHELINAKKNIIKNISFVLFSLFLLRYTKPYIIATIIPLLVSYLWVAKTNGRYALWKYLSILMVFLTGVLSVKYIFYEYNMLELLVFKQRDFVNLALTENSGSLIDVNFLEPTIVSFLINTPVALFNTFFRPFIFESFSPFVLIAGVENLLILLIGITSLLFIKRNGINKNLLLFSLFFVLITFALIGLITPVLGAIVRYKAPVLPFLIIIFIMIIDKEKLLNKFTFLKFLK